MRQRHWIPIISFVLIAAILGAVLVSVLTGHHNPRTLPSALLNKPAPAFNLPSPLTGQPGLKTADLKGGIAIVNVWASWCPPCLVEHPQIIQLSKVPGLRVFGLNQKDRKENAARWLRTHGNPYAAIGHDPEGRVGLDWGVYGVPETFILDRTGKIRFRFAGPITKSILNSTILPVIRTLQAEP